MKTKPPFHTQDNRRHETTTTLKSVKNWYFKYIVGLPTVIFWYQFHKAVWLMWSCELGWKFHNFMYWLYANITFHPLKNRDTTLPPIELTLWSIDSPSTLLFFYYMRRQWFIKERYLWMWKRAHFVSTRPIAYPYEQMSNNLNSRGDQYLLPNMQTCRVSVNDIEHLRGI